MTFRALTPNSWISDEGYSIEFVEPARAFWLKYVEGPLVVFASMELMARAKTFAIFTKQMHLGSPNSGETCDGLVRTKVIERVQKLFDHLGWNLDVGP